MLLSLAELWGKLLPSLCPARTASGQARAGPLPVAGAPILRSGRIVLSAIPAIPRRDGRHHLWIGSTAGDGLLIYDHHDWIWAYGDLAAYTEFLEREGFREGEIELPAPHAHSYHVQFDAAEDEIVAYWEWSYFPLQPGDDY